MDYPEMSLKNFVFTFHEAQACDRRFCFILGSGASRESGIRTGVALAEQWVKELKEKYRDTELEKKMKEMNIGDITPTSKNYFNIYDLRFAPDFQHGYAALERELEKGTPSIGYYALSKILTEDAAANNLVITTNFDSLVEDALFIYTDKKPLVVGHESLTEFINLNTKRPIVAKIHRSLFFHPLNRQNEINSLADEWVKVLRDVFLVYTPVVVGYAGGDQSLMRFLCDESVRMNGMYWCYWNKEKPGEDIVELVKQKGGCFVPIGGFDELMFRLSVKLGYENPEAKVMETARLRVEAYNEAYKRFETAMMEEESQQTKAGTTAATDTAETLEEIKSYNDKQLEIYNQRLKEAPTAENYRNRARLLSNKKQYAEAIADLDKAIELDPGNAHDYSSRGNAQDKIGEYDKAIADYNMAIELNPQDAKTYNNRGYTYSNMKEQEKALADHEKAVELAPQYAIAYNNRGYVYKQKKEYDKAIADYDKAIELNPQYVIAYNNRGQAFNSKKEYDKAIADFDKAIELNPEYVVAYNNRGCAHNKKKAYSKAIADFDRAIELDPQYAVAYNNRGHAYKAKGEPDKAAADFEKVKTLKAKAGPE